MGSPDVTPQHPPNACPRPIPPVGLRCPHCRYELTGLLEPRCPECGSAFDIDGLFNHALDAWPPVRQTVLNLTLGDLADARTGPIRRLADDITVTLTSAVGIFAQQHLDQSLDRDPAPDDFRDLYDRLAAGRELLIPLPRPPRILGTDFAFPDTDLRCRQCRAALESVRDGRCPQCSAFIDPADLLPHDTLIAVTSEFRQRQPLAVLLARTALETEGIPNATSAGNAALRTLGGISLATLSVPRSYFYDAVAFLNEHRSEATDLDAADTDDDTPRAGDWPCPACGEHSPANFDVCWNCGRPCD